MIILKIGARTFKTALAVLLAMLLPPLIGLGDSVGLTAAAVIFSMQPSVQETFITTRNRVVANTIGGLIAFLVVNFVGDTPVMISLATALLIAILHPESTSSNNLHVSFIKTPLSFPISMEQKEVFHTHATVDNVQI